MRSELKALSKACTLSRSVCMKIPIVTLHHFSIWHHMIPKFILNSDKMPIAYIWVVFDRKLVFDSLKCSQEKGLYPNVDQFQWWLAWNTGDLISHCHVVTWASWHLKLATNRLFAQHLIHIKTRRSGLWEGIRRWPAESPKKVDTRGFPRI